MAFDFQMQIRSGYALSLGLLLVFTSCHAQTQNVPVREAPFEVGGKRSASSIYYGLDKTGHRIVTLPGGRPYQYFAFYDIDFKKLIYYKFAETNISIERVQLSRDGKVVFAIINRRVKVSFEASKKFYVKDVRGIVQIDISTGTYEFLKTNAAEYGTDIVAEPTGRFIYYTRSLNDGVSRVEQAAPLTKYTHRFFCCTEGRYVARYDLTRGEEVILGPFMAPQGSTLIGLQATNNSLYFYASGLTRAIEFNYDTRWSPLESVRQEGVRREEFRATYLENHPTDIEGYSRAGGALPAEFLFKFPINKVHLAAGEKVQVVHSKDWGLTNAISISNSASSELGYRQHLNQMLENPDNISAYSGVITEIRPQFSDDESTIFFGSRYENCWGKITKGTALTCSVHSKVKKDMNGQDLTGGELSHDGNALIYLTQVIYPSQKQSDNVARLCIVSNLSPSMNCDWLVDNDFNITEVVLTPKYK